MKNKSKNNQCYCGGTLRPVDTFEHSQTVACEKCRYAWLLVNHPNFQVRVCLEDFHLKRGEGEGQRPFDQWNMATRLVECLGSNDLPSAATMVDFGIRTRRHYRALQRAVRAGVTEYDLDRVIGDGPAITHLVHAATGDPFTGVAFETVYDESWVEPDGGTTSAVGKRDR